MFACPTLLWVSCNRLILNSATIRSVSMVFSWRLLQCCFLFKAHPKFSPLVHPSSKVRGILVPVFVVTCEFVFATNNAFFLEDNFFSVWNLWPKGLHLYNGLEKCRWSQYPSSDKKNDFHAIKSFFSFSSGYSDPFCSILIYLSIIRPKFWRF